MNKYYDEIPYIRAIACMMVVLVHVSGNSYEGPYFADNWSLYINQFCRLGTPVFAVVSGFLLFHSVNGKTFQFSRFLRSRTTKIVIPFVIWSFVYLGVRAYFGEDVFPNVRQLLKYFLLGTAQYHLYFIVTVIQFYLLFPLLQLIKNRRIMLGVLIVSLLINYWWFQKGDISVFSDPVNTILNHPSFIFYWIAYFMMGAVLQLYYSEIKVVCSKYKYWIAIAFIGMITLAFFEIEQGKLFASSRVENLLYIPIWLLFLLMVFPFVNKNIMVTTILRVIGNYSMGIYLVHPLVITMIDQWHTLRPLVSYQLVVIFLLVMILSMLLIRVILWLPFSSYMIPVGKNKSK